jgi:hypothetical protein
MPFRLSPVVSDIQLIDPVKKEADSLDSDASTYKLSLYFFVTNLAYTIIQDIRSISLLVTEIEISPNAYKIDLRAVSKSMYSEAFGRYDSKIFQRVFLTLLDTLTFI